MGFTRVPPYILGRSFVNMGGQAHGLEVSVAFDSVRGDCYELESMNVRSGWLKERTPRGTKVRHVDVALGCPFHRAGGGLWVAQAQVLVPAGFVREPDYEFRRSLSVRGATQAFAAWDEAKVDVAIRASPERRPDGLMTIRVSAGGGEMLEDSFEM